VGEDTPLVVDHVAVAAAGAFDLFDDPVEPFGAGIRHILEQRDQDRGPPGLDRGREPGRFGELGVDRGFVEVGQPPPDLRRFVLGEEQSEPFFDRPRGLDLFGGVAAVEGSPQPGPLSGWRGVRRR
jgi:hypothetical protein